jgi:hypothetical protein
LSRVDFSRAAATVDRGTPPRHKKAAPQNGLDTGWDWK